MAYFLRTRLTSKVLRLTRTRMSKQVPDDIRSLECPPGTEYDERTFQYFLAIEQARAGRSHRPLRLLLATLESDPGKPAPISRARAIRLFGGLRQSLRDTDVMGWYRQDRIAGAVLSEGTDAPGWETPGPIEQRVGEGLRRWLPARVARTVHVRVVEQGPRQIRSE